MNRKRDCPFMALFVSIPKRRFPCSMGFCSQDHSPRDRIANGKEGKEEHQAGVEEIASCPGVRGFDESGEGWRENGKGGV